MVQQAYPPFWVSSSGFRGFVAKRDNISGWEMFDQSYQKTKQLPLSLGRIFGVRTIFAEMNGVQLLLERALNHSYNSTDDQ